MKKAAIPTVRSPEPDHNLAHANMKQNMDQLTGQTKGAKKVPVLTPDASLGQVIEAINIIAERMN